MAIPVGIDDLNLYASTLAVDFADIAAARGSSAKELRNIGFRCRSVLPSFEDQITLAVNAAKPIVETAGPDGFELLIVATETGLDGAKSLSTYVHKYLGLGHRCRNFEIKHACYAGTASLQMAAAWIRSGAASGKKALVVMTDIGRQHFHDLAELSVGAGAVALSIAAEPRVFELELPGSQVSREVYDTARPAPNFEWIDPPTSLGSYLDLLEIAWEDFRRSAGSISFEDYFKYMVYHTPLVSLTKQAHQLLLDSTDRDVTRAEVEASFDRMVGPSLTYNQDLGNTYSGSLYAGLASVLECAPAIKAGDRVGCFSYGSGACAELFSGLVQPEAHSVIAARQIGARLAARRKVGLAEYEAAADYGLPLEKFAPDWSLLPGHYEQAYQGKGLLVLQEVDNYYRTYKFS
jgi:3-hydroxy-3-methylglutaryl CoA synthase